MRVWEGEVCSSFFLGLFGSQKREKSGRDEKMLPLPLRCGGLFFVKHTMWEVWENIF